VSASADGKEPATLRNLPFPSPAQIAAIGSMPQSSSLWLFATDLGVEMGC